MTGAAPAPWLKDTGLALDDRGFIRVGEDLRATGTEAVFAVGDCAAMTTRRGRNRGIRRPPRPGSGRNLRRLMLDRPLRPHRPQRRVLGLISTGARTRSWGPLAIAGDWVWRWKDRIDRTFMDRYGDLPPMGDAPPSSPDRLPESTALAALHPIRCAGCGAKIGGGPLGRALARLGLDGEGPEDVAPIPQAPGTTLVESVDYYPAIVSDPYLFGRIAANHALSDLFASGAEPVGALALAVLPPGGEAIQEEDLYQMLAGVRHTLQVGGGGPPGRAHGGGGGAGAGPDRDGRGRAGGPDPQARRPTRRCPGADKASRHRGDLRRRDAGRGQGAWVDVAIDSMLTPTAPPPKPCAPPACGR